MKRQPTAQRRAHTRRWSNGGGEKNKDTIREIIKIVFLRNPFSCLGPYTIESQSKSRCDFIQFIILNTVQATLFYIVCLCSLNILLLFNLFGLGSSTRLFDVVHNFERISSHFDLAFPHSLFSRFYSNSLLSFASMCRRWLLLLSDSCIIIGRIYVYKVYAFAGPGRYCTYCIELEWLWIVTCCAHYMKIWNHPEIALYTFLMTFDWLISLVVFSVCDAALNDEQFIIFVGFNRLFATRCHVDCVWKSWKAIFHVFYLRMVSFFRLIDDAILLPALVEPSRLVLSCSLICNFHVYKKMRIHQNLSKMAGMLQFQPLHYGADDGKFYRDGSHLSFIQGPESWACKFFSENDWYVQRREIAITT